MILNEEKICSHYMSDKNKQKQVSQYKPGKKTNLAQGDRRYNQKQRGTLRIIFLLAHHRL